MSEESDRIADLEVMAAHQARAIDELSDELRRAFQAIEKMQRTLNALSERFAALEETSTPRPEITKPPHY